MTTPLEALKAGIEALEPFAKAWDAAMRFQNPATLAEFGAIAKHHVSSVDFLRARAAHAMLSQVEGGGAPVVAREWQLDYFAFLVVKARAAAAKAMKKFPQPNYVTLKVSEEAGEVVRGCVHYAEGRMKWDEVEDEIVQLLAMLIRLVTEGDQINGVIPPAEMLSAAPQSPAQVQSIEEVARVIDPEAFTSDNARLLARRIEALDKAKQIITLFKGEKK